MELSGSTVGFKIDSCSCSLNRIPCSRGGEMWMIWSIFAVNLVVVLYLPVLVRAVARVRHRRRMEHRSRPLFIRASKHRPDLFGIHDYETKVLEFLERSTAPMLGIYGMSGVGKSTLLRLTATCYEEQHFFRYVFFVEAGRGLTADMLQGVLARGIGWGHMIRDLGNNGGLMGDATACISSLLRDQSFLLLIDDLRAGVDLAAAGLPTTLGPRQKVIFNTTDESVFAEMGCAGNTIRMNTLGEADAWNLFKYNVRDEIIDSDPEIKQLAKEIAAKCRGFPKALFTVSRAMSAEKQLHSWIVANDLLNDDSLSSSDKEGYPCLQSFKELFACIIFVSDSR